MSNGTSETLKRINREKFEKNVLSRIPREEITDLYLNQNCTYDFLMKKYNITSWTLDKVIKEYGISKPRKQSARLVLETKYKNAGSKENYQFPGAYGILYSSSGSGRSYGLCISYHRIDAQGLYDKQHVFAYGDNTNIFRSLCPVLCGIIPYNLKGVLQGGG